MRTFSHIATKQLSKSIKIVLSSGFHIPFVFSQITIVTSLSANGSVHDLVLSIPAPALPSLFHMDNSGAAHSNFNLASPPCPPRPSSEILVKALTTLYLTAKPGDESPRWYRNLPIWAIGWRTKDKWLLWWVVSECLVLTSLEQDSSPFSTE